MSARRFRWSQFSIRTVLLITFGAACYFGGWAARQWQYEREAAAVEDELGEFASSLANYKRGGGEYPPDTPVSLSAFGGHVDPTASSAPAPSPAPESAPALPPGK